VKTIVLSDFGQPARLELREVARPGPRKNELLIRIHATTVTSGDVIIRKLPFPIRIWMSLALGRGRILGHELAGEIEAVGGEVTRFRKGDGVFASTGLAGGAYAEFICLPETGSVALKPANLTYEEAAAVPVGGLTALHFLRMAAIQPGQSVLIYGASGSVGSYAVQLARHFGAEVTAVCSTANLGWVKALGADRVIDYTAEDFSKSGETYDVIFDAVGKTSASQCQRSLKDKGTYLSVRSPSSEAAEGLVFLKGLIEAGRLKPVIDRRYPLEQVAEAHQYVESRHKKGNVVLVLGHPDGSSQDSDRVGM
jgi:NADPH:quinone reductase-like Zn-dependent oxidoreductase